MRKKSKVGFFFYFVGNVAVRPGAVVAVAVESIAHHVASNHAVAVFFFGRLPLDHDL